MRTIAASVGKKSGETIIVFFLCKDKKQRGLIGELTDRLMTEGVLPKSITFAAGGPGHEGELTFSCPSETPLNVWFASIAEHLALAVRRRVMDDDQYRYFRTQFTVG